MPKSVARFVEDESGSTAIEYGLIGSLVGIVIIAGLRIIGPALNDTIAMVYAQVSAS